MSSKKKRIAKGLGASALAVATLASGLSFGATSAMSATLSSTEMSQSKASLDPNDLDPTAWGRFFTIATPAGTGPYKAAGDSTVAIKGYPTESQARNSTSELALPKPGQWQHILIRSAPGNQQSCLSANNTNIPGISAVLPAKCSATSTNQLFTIEEGRIVSYDNPFSYVREVRGGEYYFAIPNVPKGEAPLVAEWNGAPIGDSSRLAGSVEFAAGVDTRAVVKGSTEASGRVEIRRGSTVIASDTADSNGDYSIAIPAPDKAGDDELTVALVENNADKKTIKVIAAYGAGVAITAPGNNENVSGQYEIRGNAQNGSNVTVRLNNGAERAVEVNGNGQWSADVTLPMGETTITATQKSKGANTTTSAVTVNPGESSVAPLVIESPADDPTFETPVQSDSNRVLFTGTGERGARVQVLTQTSPARTIVNTTVGDDGRWSALGTNLAYDVNYRLDTLYTPVNGESVKGEHRVRVENSDPGQSLPFAFTTPQNNTEVGAPDKKVRLAGKGTTGTEITIWNWSSKDRVIGTATVDKSGDWVIPEASLNNQNNKYALHVEYTAPGQTTQTLTHTITVKAEDGTERPFDLATPGEGATVIAPDKTVRLAGTATTGTEVTIWNYMSKDRVIGKATADGQGNWAIPEASLNNQNTRYALHVEYTVPGQSTQTLTRNITVKAEDRTEQPFDLKTPGQGSTVIAPDNKVTFAGTGTTGTEISIWNWHTKDRLIATTTIDGNGDFEVVGELNNANLGYGLHVEYTAPGQDTETLTRNISITP
ncbi:hypothetical protein [Curtobacterium sp. GD1]|uniref:hypothetical protein n=1 Tax=Curtobacterium sp. GD1 TaxID=2810612 RepID=UPI001E45E443|nr:hypothetical protein [Curtobacterium sp. GD1]MCC8907977.1 hypothetical protein [Curtobacterium sp. GD1]